jgi:hypothetical protein
MGAKILSFFSSIKSSAGEYLAVAITTLITGLVAALKLQGSRLHKAQVDLLASKLQASQDSAQAEVVQAQDAYLKALANYNNAGGKL